MNQKGRQGLSYAQAGVDIDAGNSMVDLIKPAVRAGEVTHGDPVGYAGRLNPG